MAQRSLVNKLLYFDMVTNSGSQHVVLGRICRATVRSASCDACLYCTLHRAVV